MTEKKSKSLPSLPKGKEFEEYISAFFQASGMYLERNITERAIEEVLELDIITTDYNKECPHISLVELKSGDWGFPDIFKIAGWLHYLNLPNAIFIAHKNKERLDFLKAKAKQMNVSLVVISDLIKTKESLREVIGEDSIKEKDIIIWRWAYCLERKLLELLTQKKKKNMDLMRYKALAQYYHDVTSRAFFIDNLVEKLQQLYDSFKNSPKISSMCANEIAGNGFQEAPERIPDSLFQETYFQCKLNDIQVSSFIEHKARLSILKTAVDLKLFQRLGNTQKTTSIIKLLGHEFDQFHGLPENFRSGLEEISTHKYFHRYPIFWQWFLWVFGGFILLDYADKEYEILSEKTGIPKEDIPNAFKAYELLFKKEGGWFTTLTSNIKTIHMPSVPFAGLGAHYRKMLYCNSNKYEDLKLNAYGYKDIYKWNNLFVNCV